MFFNIVEDFREVPPSSISTSFLVVDYWDDWFSFRTMFNLWLFDEHGTRHHVGSVKVGQHGLRPSSGASPGTEMPPDTRYPNLPRAFDFVDGRFFSLGQDENYYETLNSLSENLRNRVLLGLRDCAFDLDIFEAARMEQVMHRSLLRSVSAPTYPASLRFYPDPPASWHLIKRERVSNHFRKFGLGTLYASHSGVELTNIQYGLQRIAERGTAEDIRTDLKSRADSARAAHINSWQTAMYYALVESDWFCAGGFK